MEVVLLLASDERERIAEALSAGGPPDAVDVDVRFARDVVVDNVTDALDVDPTGGDVGRDQDTVVPRAESFERLDALGLASVAVDHGRPDAAEAELTRDPVGAVLGPREDEHARHRLVGEQLDQEIGLEVGRNGEREVGDAYGGRRRRVDLDGLRLREEVPRQTDDLGRHRRAEQHRLAAAGEPGEDPPDVGEEPHIEHPVGLVQDEDLEVREVHVAAAHVVEEAARGRHDDLRTPAERALLFAHPHAAVDRGAVKASVPAELVEELVRLQREFARGGEDEGEDAAVGVIEQPLEDRQEEGGGLAGAGLGRPDEVAAEDGVGDRAALDGGRLGVAELADARPDGRVEGHVLERGRLGVALLGVVRHLVRATHGGG
ncbi:MAG: hypothetical protein L3J77_01990 [Thermoplasmata archaeon]|nr:hypothetical protein [Thermoplasmata archaeon]